MTSESILPMDKPEGKEQAKEDYALEKVPSEGRTLGWPSLASIVIGIATAIFFLQFGSTLAIQYGAVNALLSAIYAAITAGVLGTIIAYYSAKTGLTINLWSRGGGFGHLGSSITSLIFAANFIMYLAFEAMIVVYAAHEYFPGIPKWGFILFFGIIVVPLCWYGVHIMEKLQKWTLPIIVVFIATAFIISLNTPSLYEGSIWSYLPKGVSVGGTALLACIGIQNGLIGVMALVGSDFARFIKRDEIKIGSIAVGFLPHVISFLIFGIIGIWFGVRMGEMNPGLYLVKLIGFGAVLLIMLTQIRINVTILYGGSIALSNFFENIFKFTPGRPFWVAVTGMSAIGLMLADILDHLNDVLTIQGIVLFSWLAILICDILIVKNILNIGPKYIEYRREYLYAWNPVGIVSLIVASTLGTIAAFGYMGEFLQNTSAYFAVIIASLFTIVMAKATSGKYYIKKRIRLFRPKNMSHKKLYVVYFYYLVWKIQATRPPCRTTNMSKKMACAGRWFLHWRWPFPRPSFLPTSIHWGLWAPW